MKKLIQPFGLLAVLLLLVAGWGYNICSNMEVYHSRTGIAKITVSVQTHKTGVSSQKRKLTTTFFLNPLREGTYKLGVANHSEKCKSINTNRSINIYSYDTTSVTLRLQCNAMPDTPWKNKFVYLIDSRKGPVLYSLMKDGSEVKTLNAPDLFLDQTINKSKIVFSKDGNIWTFETTDGLLKQVTTGGNDRQPDWSPDGTKIAFSRIVDGNHEVFIMNKDGSNQQNITNNAAEDVAPDWSPDGLKIAFTSDRDGDKEIFVTYPRTNKIRQLTDNTRTDHSASWSPDGRKIMLIGEGWMGMEHIYLAGFNGRITKQLTSFPHSLLRDVILPNFMTPDDIKHSKESLLNSGDIPPFRTPKTEAIAQLVDM
ncbi:WD40-like Beta Propeller Repeat [Fodinibius salinus]|uniref:WD40-like Beta Propeller Repeat n=1 Tax=Fodinibius salinus TaxID=860790 RepID=A0A5D3YHA4_9BACT|nr:PD40 domain-containing protein [Fodinibius salinus]TYP92801.1 WD40-like Beta Propeller Repeat [Fodinibius salinus]